jgi:hypothetical protein
MNRFAIALLGTLVPIYGGAACYLAEFEPGSTLKYLTLVLQVGTNYIWGLGFWQVCFSIALLYLMQRRA